MLNIFATSRSLLHITLLALFSHLIQITLAHNVTTYETAYVAWNPTGEYIAVTTYSSVAIIEASTALIINMFPVNRVTLNAPIWSSNGQLLGFSNGTDFEIWANVLDTPSLYKVYANAIGSKAAVWSPDGSIIALSNGDYVEYWDIESQSLIQRYQNDGIGSPWSLDWRYNRLLIGGTLGVSVVTIEQSMQIIAFLLEPYVDSQGFYVNPVARSVKWSPNNEQIAIGSTNGLKLIRLDDYTNNQFNVLDSSSNLSIDSQGDIYSVDWHPNGKFVASSGEDGIQVWGVQTGAQVYSVDPLDNVTFQSVAWSPDGTQLAYGSPTDQSRVIIVSSEDIFTVLATPTQAISSTETPTP